MMRELLQSAGQQASFSPQQAQAWSQHGFSAEQAQHWQAQVDPRREYPVEPDEAREWQQLGYSPEQVGRLLALAGPRHNAMVSPYSLNEWECAFAATPPALHREELEGWFAGGVTEARDALAWQNAGYSPEQAGQWHRQAGAYGPLLADQWQAQFPGGLQDAIAWYQQAGICLPEIADHWQSAGFTAQEAGQWMVLSPLQSRDDPVALRDAGLDAASAQRFYHRLQAVEGDIFKTTLAYHRAGLGPQDLYLYRTQRDGVRALGPQKLARYMKSSGLSSQQAGRCLRQQVPVDLARLWAEELDGGANLDELLEHWRNPQTPPAGQALGELLG